MKKIEKIAAALIGIGILGVICCADSLETSPATFAIGEAVSFGLAFIGLAIEKAAEAETPAATMKNCEKQNS